MVEIELCGGEAALVDDADLKLVEGYRWHVQYRRYRSEKVVQTVVTRLHGVRFFMHRLIMPPPDGFVVDHINRNPLDNRRSNLRLCTPQQNILNRGRMRNNRSGYKGVYLDRTGPKLPPRWRAQIYLNHRRYNLGTFDSKRAAAIAYIVAAKRLHGEFAQVA